jgi:hypothetical protein
MSGELEDGYALCSHVPTKKTTTILCSAVFVDDWTTQIFLSEVSLLTPDGTEPSLRLMLEIQPTGLTPCSPLSAIARPWQSHWDYRSRLRWGITEIDE